MGKFKKREQKGKTVSRKVITIGRHSFTRIIKVNTDGLFWIDWPEDIRNAMGIGECTANHSMDVVVREFSKVVKEYVELQVVPVDVICYDVEYIRQPDDGPERYNYHPDLGHHAGIGLVIYALPYKELERTSSKGTKYYEYRPIKDDDWPDTLCYRGNFGPPRHGSNKRECQVPYNDKNKAFFIALNNALCGLVDKIVALKPEHIQAIAESGKFLKLLGPK